jgi:long-chain acyl-CoA synthetase
MKLDLYSLIKEAVTRYPDALAMVTPDGQEISYAQVATIIERFTNHAAHTGLRRGNKVLVRINNYTIQLLLIIALSRLGVTCFFGCSPSDTEEAGLALDATISELSPATIPSTGPSARMKYIPFTQGWLAPSNGTHEEASGFAHENDTVIVLGSSGTTGKKKLIPMHWAVIRNRILHVDPVYGTDFQRLLITPGVRTGYGFIGMLRALRHGAAILQPQDSPRKILELMNHYQVDQLCTSPGIIADLVMSQQEAHVDLPSLRRIIFGGSTISLRLLERASACLCRSIVMFYGATECSFVAAGELDQLLKSPAGTVGDILPGIKVAILDIDGQSLPVTQEGKVAIQVPPSIRIADYISSGSGTSSFGNDGWFYPGDKGYLSGQGLLVITGRFSDVINMGGNKFSPESIEAKLSVIKGVLRTGVVGVRNAHGFEDICVAAVCDKDVEHDYLLGNIKRLLGDRVPLKLKLMNSLPFNDGGKIDRTALRKMFATTTIH